MGRLLKYLVYLLVICVIILAVYALVFDLPAPQTDVVVPVEVSLQ